VVGATLALLVGPTVLAFWSGGYFDSPRAVAGAVAWALVAVALLAGQPQPRSRHAVLALGGLALFAAWTLLSILWAPIAGSAYHAGQRIVLYVGVLLAASMLLRDRAALRSVEPILAGGTLIVIGYGLSERLLPGLLHFQRSASAYGRLEQPLTYWNAMGEVAAIGLVLCARLAGDTSRQRWLRVVAAAAAAPLGMGLYLSFSRGALFAGVAGLTTLLVALPSRQQWRSILLTLVAGTLAAAASAPFAGVTSLHGSLSARESQGATTLALLVLIVALAGSAQMWLARGSERALRLPRGAPWLALGLICIGLAVALLAGAKERSSGTLSVGANRLTTLQSNRYSYWNVAWRAFRDEPVRGVGAGGWAVYWLRLRPIGEGAADAHSLPLQTLAELGVVGLALLAAFLAGIGLAAADALRLAPGLAAGPVAASVAYVAHAPLDWDWEMPAVTLIALLLGGALLALIETEDRLGAWQEQTDRDATDVAGRSQTAIGA
jgi:O-antigen ligase